MKTKAASPCLVLTMVSEQDPDDLRSPVGSECKSRSEFCNCYSKVNCFIIFEFILSEEVGAFFVLCKYRMYFAVLKNIIVEDMHNMFCTAKYLSFQLCETVSESNVPV